ncbi:MAG TPA: DUF885 domain-containing protein [Candidatus Eisenbacteria bacterium]|nr:DUF885 domain-containing protein [Candidatus Eisenbacteria bacterium]
MRGNLGWLAVAALVVVTLSGCTNAAKRAAKESAQLHALADRYYAARFDFEPSSATDTGIHDRDSKLEDYSDLRLQFEHVSLRAFMDTLTTAIDTTALTPDDLVDFQLLRRDAEQRLMAMEELKLYERYPDLYHQTASNAIYSLIKRNFAPLDDRLRAVADREDKIPDLIDQGKANLKNPPEIYTRVAIEQAQGTVDFFSKVVPAAAADCKDPALKARVLKANEECVGVCKDYLHWLQTDLLPRSKGDFALGRDLFMKRCRMEEGITETPETLLAEGLRAVEENHRQMLAVARQIDSTATFQEVLARTEAHHPSAAGLLDSCRAELTGLRQFIVDHRIVPLPGGEDLHVTDTPVFERSLVIAQMDSPGPLEDKAKEAFYYVTPPDAKLSAAEQDEYLHSFCRGLVYTTSSHEAYPGHYVQGLYQRQNPDLIRKLSGSYAYSEGWAHYCEQMMLDEGFSKDPELRLYQLHDALLRLCRLVLTVRMHTQGWTVEQAADYLVREGYQPKPTAMVEAKRYTSDPLVLSYTWGKWHILKLRDEVKKRMGAAYSISDFHKRLLSLGGVTIPQAETLLLTASAPKSP